jgi:hypothetical protein
MRKSLTMMLYPWYEKSILALLASGRFILSLDAIALAFDM